MDKYWLKMTFILYILWIVLSGRFEAKFLLIGLVSCGIIAKLCISSLWVSGRDNERMYSIIDTGLWAFTKYGFWLLIEIIKASLDVAKAVLSPKMKINPQIIEFDCRYQNPMAISMLINSIILTPGTVTLDVENNCHFVVHALTDDAAKGLIEGSMQRKIAELFRE